MEDKKKNRMLELTEAFENANEIYKNNIKEPDQEKISEEYKRLQKLISKETNKDFKEKDFKNENYYMAGSFNTGGRGQTVNSILDDTMGMGTQSKMPKPEKQSLQPQEALVVCVGRTLKSGAPVNNIDFYEEVNWNLANLGFPAKNPVDIKEIMLELLGYDK